MTAKPLCVLLDDEVYALEALKEKIEDLNLLEIERSFLDPDNLLDTMDSLKADIFLLDIEMGTSGIEIAKKLKNKAIIFVSGHKGNTADVVEVNPVAYVEKPIKKHKLKFAIEKAIERRVENSTIIVLKTQNSKKEEVKQDEIVYIESNQRDKEIYLKNEESLIAKNLTMEDLLSQLSGDFLQINPQNIVNLKYVTKLLRADTVGFTYKNKVAEFTLGTTFKEAFFEAKPHLKV